MNEFSKRKALLIATLLLCSAELHASADLDNYFDDKDKPWQEVAALLPAAPKAENLIPFYVSATATYSFAIDAKSLTVGEDGVVRYTVVGKSPAGAENVSYEGIRCKVKEKKLYAFGRKDGSWSRSRRDQWEPITQHVSNPHQAALANDFFCTGEAVSDNAETIIYKLRTRPVSSNVMPR